MKMKYSRVIDSEFAVYSLVRFPFSISIVNHVSLY